MICQLSLYQLEVHTSKEGCLVRALLPYGSQLRDCLLSHTLSKMLSKYFLYLVHQLMYLRA
jgi:hypothetical protein